ncbi:MAG: O-antigen ligase family protein [Planctomycetia bacterium]|nr:O-antigen ligase family protein [Planctomycetia bacterium]
MAALPIVIVIGLLPWLFGGVHLSSQLLLAGCLSLALLVCIVVISDNRCSLPLTLVPLLLAIGLGVVQQFPLGSALGLVSPRAQTLWSGPTRENTSSEDGFALEIGESPARGGSTISLYPLSTRHDVTRLLMAVAVFFVSSQLFSHRKWQRPLFGVLAANGAVFAFFGIAQQLVWNGQIYGRVSLTQGGRPFAAFVNSNNAGEFLNLCLAAAIGFTLYAFSRDSQPSASGRSQVGSNWLLDAYHRALDGIAKLDAPKLLSLVMLVLIFAGLLCTLSRGAWLAMLVATAVVAALWAASRRVAYVAWTLVLVIGLGIGLVDWLGRTDAISARWGSLQSQLSDPSDGRLAHWPDGLRAGSDFWRLGSGLGTYRHVYRPYSETDRVWFYHAENQFVEAFCEGGVIGLALLLMAIVTVALASRNLLRARSLERRICGVVGIYALVSQSVQACFDFGLYLPANMALFALLCGTVTGANALLRQRNPSRWREVITGLTQRTDMQVGFATLLFCGMLLSVVDLNQGRAVEAALQESQAADVNSEDSLVFITSQIGKLSAALASCPGHAEGQQRLAQLWVHRYRLRTVRQLEALAPEGTRHEDLWALTFPLVVQGTVQQYAKEGRTIELENLRRSAPVQIDLKNASRALLRAIGGCPLLGGPIAGRTGSRCPPDVASDGRDCPGAIARCAAIGRPVRGAGRRGG